MPEAAGIEPPTVAGLFTGFLGLGIIGFGGVLPWARRMIVEQRGWLDEAEFVDLVALCQFLPGPNIVNVAVALGVRFRGLAGSLAALAGLLAAPTVIVLTLGGVYARFGQLPVVAHAFTGLAAAASALVVAMAVRLAGPVRRHAAGVAVAVVTFVAIAGFRLPLLPAMLVLAPVSAALCWWFDSPGVAR